MKELKLYGGKVTLVDDDVYEKCHKWPWHIDAHGYVSRTFKAGGVAKRIKLHHFVLGNPSKGMTSHHIDCNKLNNQLSNLELVAADVNRHIKDGAKPASGYYGVYYQTTGSIITTIRKANVRYHLGSFKTPEAAARVYDEKALELYGRYAKLNFPPQSEEDKNQLIENT